MNPETETMIDASWLQYGVPSANHASSLSNYLNGHGVVAMATSNEVTVPVDGPQACADVYGLYQNWKRWWDNPIRPESELYGLPLYTKEACRQHVE